MTTGIDASRSRSESETSSIDNEVLVKERDPNPRSVSYHLHIVGRERSRKYDTVHRNLNITPE